MSTSYMAIFIFSIAMCFVVAILGSVTHSKASLGVIVWGYTAWLMYKRNNDALVSVFRLLLWFEAIAGVVGFIAMTNDSGMSGLIGFTKDIYLLIIAVNLVITYLLFEYFKGQKEFPSFVVNEKIDVNTKVEALENKTTKTSSIQSLSSTKVSDEDYWESASLEFNSDARKQGLWAKCFSEADGDENKAKALYLRVRAEQLISEAKKALTEGALIEYNIQARENKVIETVNEQELYGITFDGEKFNFQQYKYDKLEDAIRYARLVNKRK